MNKLNNGAIIKVSAIKPATAHIHNRCASCKKNDTALNKLKEKIETKANPQ